MFALVILLCVWCFFTPYTMPNDPNRANIALAKRPPSGNFPFGTDWLGRCVYSRILAGASASVFSSIFVVAATLGIGATIGVMCGYLGGLVDTLLMRLVDIFLAFPGMVLALAVAGILGPGMRNAIIALVAVGWPQYARLARSCVLTLRRANFIYAAQLNGQSSVEIMCRHILPNVIRLLIVTASLSLGGTLTSISGLSFLGLGARPPLAEWGSMLSDGRSFLQQSPWLVLFPGLAILLTAILFNMLGDCVRDALDPREKNKNIIF